MFASVARSAARRFAVPVSHTSLRPLSTGLLHSQHRVLAPLNKSSSLTSTQVKFYSHAPALTKDIIQDRIVELLESYSKTNKDVQIDASSSFSKDLGLDSFDVVEVVMEIEYEFSIIIPDNDADDLKTVGQTVEYIAKQPDAC